MYSYALILYNASGVIANKAEAARYYKMATDIGDNVSMHYYEICYCLVMEFCKQRRGNKIHQDAN